MKTSMSTGIKNALYLLCAVCAMFTISVYSAYAAPQALEYTTDDFLPDRIEPKGEAAVYDVTFNFLRGPIRDPYAAVEGHGVGARQWLSDPGREDYAFLGWYDNPEGTGAPYTKDTPIYKNTDLYAKWRYTGLGGCWPRPHRGIIHGVEEGGIVVINETISITVDGYNMHLKAPNDQRFRWFPIRWRTSEDMKGSFPPASPFASQLSIKAPGKCSLFITYKEEIFDGAGWQETGQTHEVEEVTFQATVKSDGG